MRGRVDDREGVKKRIDHIDDKQEKSRRREQRKLHRPKAPPGACAVHRGGFNQAFGDGLQTGQEEKKVVGDLLPHRCGHDQQHGVGAVEQMVPVNACSTQPKAHDANAGREHEEPQHPGHGGRHGIGPDQQGFVDRCAAHHAVGHHREHQRNAQACRGHQHRKHGRGFERLQVGLVSKEPRKVFTAHVLRADAKSV